MSKPRYDLAVTLAFSGDEWHWCVICLALFFFWLDDDIITGDCPGDPPSGCSAGWGFPTQSLKTQLRIQMCRETLVKIENSSFITIGSEDLELLHAERQTDIAKLKGAFL
jgi:hypothetical protein